jgi:hypothetical protein
MAKPELPTPRSFQPLLAAELKRGRGVIETRLATWPVEKLMKEGYCLRNLDGYWLDNNDPTSNTAVAGFACEPGYELPWHTFQYARPFGLVLRLLLIVPRPGMCVLVSKIDPLMEEGVREGVVIGHSATELHLAFERRWNVDNEKWRYGNELSFLTELTLLMIDLILVHPIARTLA